MCDEHFEEAPKGYHDSRSLTRRQFGAITLGLGVNMLFPVAAKALPVTESNINIKTPDGKADCYFVHPIVGAHAGVIVWPDILGLRPTFRKLGKRLAESGYSVLVVNPYYRQRHAPVVPTVAGFAEEAARAIVTPLAEALTPQRSTIDARAFVEFLDDQRSVDRKRKIGTVGYSIGGPIVLRTAAVAPNRVGAGVSFYGGNLVTDQPDSPHLLIPKMKAQFFVGIAENDDQRDPKIKEVLKESFVNASLPAEIEVYAGASHGWCSPDSTVYNQLLAERAWNRLLVLFGSALAG
jgi:carboxymethylenebutenolidase